MKKQDQIQSQGRGNRYMPIGQDVEILRVVSGYRDLSALFTDAED
ncbi:hypothetical protein [Phormidium nigroviride]